MPEIVLDYTPRKYQKKLHDLIDNHRFVVAVCHRRFGKSYAMTQHFIREALKTKKRNWRGYIVCPTIGMAKAIHFDYWQMMAKQIPNIKFNQSELSCTFPNGSRMQLVGANDGGERLRGRFIDLICLDEFQMMNEELFNQIVRPAMVDRDGLEGERTRCIFIGTPKLQNILYKMYKYAESDESGEEWQEFLMPVSLTQVVPIEELEQAKNTMGFDNYMSEFEVSFESNLTGSYYGNYMQKAYDEGRIGVVEEDLDLKTEVYIDLGINDATSLWFAQRHQHEIRFIDYLEYQGEGLQYLADILEKKSYDYSRIILPHDVRVRDLSLGVSRLQILHELGVKDTEIAPKLPIADGIATVRHNFENFWFDEGKCAEGIMHLKSYTKVYDSRHRVYRDRPAHNEHSHCADALRYGMALMGTGTRGDWSEPLKIETIGLV
tara:strand:+ start:1447 stop:2748 length:1302 start_codon:yes stop_codon:yes gene_type:complete